MVSVFMRGGKLEPFTNKVKGGYNFWVYTPDKVEGKKPLVVFLHGQSLCGRNLSRVRTYGPLDAIDRGKKIDAYILAPQNPGGSWKPEKVMALVAWMQVHYEVDANRIYVVGMSLGGYGTIDFSATYPDRIAAAMAICGGGTVKDNKPLSRLPLWILHGTADRAVPIAHSDRIVNELKSYEGGTTRLIYNRLQGFNHGRPGRLFYMTECYDWLFSHSLQDEGRPVNRGIRIDENVINRGYVGISHRGHLRAEAKNGTAEPTMDLIAILDSVADNNERMLALRRVAMEHEAAQAQRAVQQSTIGVDQPADGEEGAMYRVRKGDNLSIIAKRCHTTVARLRSMNSLKTDNLRIGQMLKVPMKQ